MYELPLLGEVLRQRLPHHSSRISSRTALLRSSSAERITKVHLNIWICVQLVLDAVVRVMASPFVEGHVLLFVHSAAL